MANADHADAEKRLSVLTTIDQLGEEVSLPEEETFLLFSTNFPPHGLGFIDSKGSTIEICVAGVDLNIHQSPTILSSNRKEGTTGAVVWQITPLFAEWIATPGNILFQYGILDQQIVVLELGCGVSGINALVLAPKVARYIATDQEYVLKLCQRNIDENTGVVFRGSFGKIGSTRSRIPKGKESLSGRKPCNIEILALDWELNALDDLASAFGESARVIIACDCIYNDEMTEAFVNTCAAASKPAFSQSKPTVCIIAQQLRSAEVFEGWLACMLKHFHVWRIPDMHLTRELCNGSGFAIHIATLRG